MKKLFVFIFFMLLMHDVSAQSLMDVYKKGVVKLTPDTEYAQSNDWDKIFETKHDNYRGLADNPTKNIVMMPNGSVVLNYFHRNYYLMFDENGKFVKEFGITGTTRHLQKLHSTRAYTMISGVINNNLFFGCNNNADIVCFDFKGKYVKTLNPKYPSREMIPMTDNKIAMVGMTGRRDKNRTCNFVAIMDYQTGEQKIVWEHFTEKTKKGTRRMFDYSYTSKKGGFSIITMPFIPYLGILPPQIAFVNDRLIVVLQHSNEILIYDVNGKLLSKESIKWGKKYLSVEEQKEIQKKAIEKYSDRKNMSSPSWFTQEEYTKAIEIMLKQMEEDLNKITAPLPLPVFSNIIKDSDGNLLFFEMPETAGGNKFNVWVYQNGGKFVCQSSFECDDYDLFIAPSRMVFHNRYIYALQTLKKADGNPLRLVRFKVSN